MSINSVLILYPVCALAFLTFLVMVLIPLRRWLPKAPPDVNLPNRNYMNLLEAPVLFYVACIVAFVANLVTPGMVALAWGYVGLRLLHSIVHLTYNKVPHRGLVFGASNVVLVVMWVRLAATL